MKVKSKYSEKGIFQVAYVNFLGKWVMDTATFTDKRSAELREMVIKKKFAENGRTSIRDMA